MDLEENTAIEKAIAQHLATGKYATAEEVMLTALERLKADDAEDEAEYRDTLEGLQRSLADVEAGRVTPATVVFDEIRRKHGFREPEQT